jgi:hypothetical protein
MSKHSIPSMHVLSSYPRSGNHLIRFIIEYISGFPTKGCSLQDKPVCLNEYDNSTTLEHVSIDNDFIVHKTHQPRPCSSIIAITRDYRECIVKYLKYNIVQPNEDSISQEIHRYLHLIVWYFTQTAPILHIQYEKLIRSNKNSQDIYNLVLFIIAHNDVVDERLHSTITERMDTFICNKKELFHQCAQAKKRHWGGFNSDSRIKYHILRLPFTSRYYFEKLFLQCVREMPTKSQEIILRHFETLKYSPGYADYVILPTGGICNRLRTILRYLYHYQKQNETCSKWDVETSLYVIWRKTEHCRQSFSELFDLKFLESFACEIVPYDESFHKKTVCFDSSDDVIIPLHEKCALHQLYHALLPNQELKRSVGKITPTSEYIAVHVRRTDHSELAKSKKRYTKDEDFHTFIQKCPNNFPIFLATDNRQTQIEFLKKYGNRVSWYKDIPVSTERRHHTSEQAAVVDLFVCSTATHFKGSGYSSFTDTIHILRERRNVRSFHRNEMIASVPCTTQI